MTPVLTRLTKKPTLPYVPTFACLSFGRIILCRANPSMVDVKAVPMDFGSFCSASINRLSSSNAVGLSAAQLSELQLAMQRSIRAKSGCRKLEGVKGVVEEERDAHHNHGAKRRHTNSADKAGAETDSDDDCEDDLSKLTPEERASLIAVEGRPGGIKEARKLRRLLRNRMSAQQARERKKMFVINLQEQAKEQQRQMTDLQNRLQLIESHNNTLRCIIRSMPREIAEDTGHQANWGCATAP
eukprot:gene17956-24360_t